MRRRWPWGGIGAVDFVLRQNLMVCICLAIIR